MVQDEQLAAAFLSGHGFGQFIQKAWEHVGVHARHDERKEFAALWGAGADDVLAKVIAQLGHGAGLARLPPASAWPGIAFEAGLSAKP